MNNIFTKWIFSFTTLLLVNNAFATGFFIPLQSSSQQGNARAGGAAISEDASDSFYNAASISRVTRLLNRQLSFSLSGDQSNLRFYGTMHNTGFKSLSKITQKGKATSSPAGVFPSFYFVTKLVDHLSLGLLTTTVYGFGLSFPDTSIVRYALVYSGQRGVDFAPSLSLQISPEISFGVGPDFLYYALRRKQALRTEPLTLADSYLTTYVWSTVTPGFHLGLLYEPCKTMRFGLSYRSPFVVHLNGSSNTYANKPLKVPKIAVHVLPTNGVNNTTIKIPLAGLAILSFYGELSTDFAVMASIEYMNWGMYRNDVVYRLASPFGGNLDASNIRNLVDTYRFAVGCNYALIPKKLILRGGVAYNPGATTTTYRQVTLPDLNYTSLSLGAHFQYDQALGFDFAYSRAFPSRGPVHDVNPTTGNTLIGIVAIDSNAISFQVNYAFLDKKATEAKVLKAILGEDSGVANTLNSKCKLESGILDPKCVKALNAARQNKSIMGNKVVSGTMKSKCRLESGLCDTSTQNQPVANDQLKANQNKVQPPNAPSGNIDKPGVNQNEAASPNQNQTNDLDPAPSRGTSAASPNQNQTNDLDPAPSRGMSAASPNQDLTKTAVPK